MKTTPFEREFKRDVFSCGKTTLDNYILRNVTKDVQAGACTCFVLLEEDQRVIGFYTLSTDSIPSTDAPDEIRKKINYSKIPVILLGRLAIDSSFFGKGYGKFLLVDALTKCVHVSRQHIGAAAIIVDPIDNEAIAFYSKFGFTLLPGSSRMFMSMNKVETAFKLPK